ncbi:hypothetical protein K432DRAFT_423313 [Lepidopterella palustris CBS 459.81]|uniref:Fermentation associated protein n=1 Tax=Lepidopterella palustris CBS 459.81 TaxID=1314670 RepID=A0A8E2EGM6_9PEZI|nr:hypothetical protein K432DRAFT_423313 [Lepidopterella palustris CBS 459.81]
MAGGLTSEPLNSQSGFNWVFLVELLVCGILTVFFLFYFNRLFATLVSYGIRSYTWHTYHAYIDIQALQISLLGGRIFFKDIRYHAHNETILVHGGYITWEYWLRRVKDAELFTDDQDVLRASHSASSSIDGSPRRNRNRSVDKEEKGGAQKKKSLPCRISINVSGVEAFMYNRSPAYDGIVDAMLRTSHGEAHSKDTAADTEVAESVRSDVLNSSVNGKLEQEGSHANRLSIGCTGESNGPNVLKKVSSKQIPPQEIKVPEPPAFLRLFPIYIECNKGAIVVGNENTSAVITAQFEKASGEIDAASSGPLDVYQQLFNFQFTHPVVHMRPNPDFKSPQLDQATRLKKEAEEELPEVQETEKRQHHEKQRKPWLSLRSLSAMFSKSTDSISAYSRASAKKNQERTPQMAIPGQERWQGLTRYLDESQRDEHDEWDAVEYAKTSLIVDCPCINISFYWDFPGPVSLDPDNPAPSSSSLEGDVNGAIPPEYGLDLEVHGGTINYGPWADRHRAIFQSFFFPSAHVDAIPATPLKPGEPRVYSTFKLYLCIEEDTVLRIPVREPSKDWKWKGKAQNATGHGKKALEKGKAKGGGKRKGGRSKQRDKGVPGPNVRPFAWLDIKIVSNSTINYTMDMVASNDGYRNSLDVDVRGTEISSSVNHGLLWRSGPLALDCDLSNPLSWNQLRKWAFNLTCNDLELFLLRDHLFLLTDLVSDWGSGPSPDYFTFTPFLYLLNIDLQNFKLYLNTNDSNIVNNPSDLEDNNFVILFGRQLHAKLTIPLDQYRPLRNEIPFDVQAQDLGLDLCVPPKNSLYTFVRSKNVAQLEAITITGSHNYFTETSTANTDRLHLDIHGTKLSLDLYGFIVRHFMKIKDNYFGDDLHFKTLEEYQGLPSQNLAVDGTISIDQHVNKSNDLDVILCISVDHASISVPANLYSAESSIRIDLPYASADLRFTNYYMDLMVNFSPLSVSLSRAVSSLGAPVDPSGQTEIFIESVDIFGHRLFGLPPTEPTYVCNWDFDVGNISGECSGEFLEKAAGAARSFAFTFDDDENALPVSEPLVIYDSTFLRLKTKGLHVWLHVAKEVLLLSAGPITVDFNDLAGTTFSQRLKVLIPDLTVACLDARSASRHRTRTGEQNVVETHAFFQTTLSLNMLKRNSDFTLERDKQQSHMREHDQRTNRMPFLLMDDQQLSLGQTKNTKPSVEPPAMQFPSIAKPILLDHDHETSGSSDTSSGINYSDTGSSYHHASARGRPFRPVSIRSSSNSSLTKSIRSAHGLRGHQHRVPSSQSRTLVARSLSRGNSTDYLYSLPGEEEKEKRGMPPSSVALSSSFATPYFPLDLVEPDLSNVPVIPVVSEYSSSIEDDLPMLEDVSTKVFDENFVHTSFIISAEPGIRVYCTPQAIRSAANLVSIINPNHAEDLLDAFQVDVMSKILDLQRRREGKGKLNEINLRIPFIHLRFVNEFTKQSGEESEVEKDQYDLVLDRLRVAARIKDCPGEHAGESTVSLHTTLKSLSMSIKERALDVLNDDVAIQARVDDLLLWALKGKHASINLSFKTFEVSTASKTVEYLASLIHRSTLLGKDLATRFENLEIEQQKRLRFLAWILTTSQNQSPDPAFLTRPSYALRVTRDHLRNHDSWKIISRFRYIWQCLPENEKARLEKCCLRRITSCPNDAKERVISMWDQWRTWDLAHVKKSLAMRTLYGSFAEIQKLSKKAMPVNLDIRSIVVKLVLDPGPKQSEASMQHVLINLAITPPLEPAGLMLVEDETLTKSTLLQINSRNATVRISWEICELVEILLKMFQNMIPSEENVAQNQLEATPQNLEKDSEQPENHDFQIVYATGDAEISLDGINLRCASMARGLEFSVVGSDKAASNQGLELCILVHADAAATEMLSRSRLMLRSRLDQPSLYFSRNYTDRGQNSSEEIKIAGASRMITVEVKEDILGFIETFDSVLRCEVAYFHRQAQVFQQSSKPKPIESNTQTVQLPNITIALLMDAYLIEVALLQSLKWSISGESGRISVAPALRREMTLNIDFDLDKHTHKMYSSTMENSIVIAALDLPPVNGSLSVTYTDKQTTIKASTIIDAITFQASEIQGLITTINKPEISSIYHAAQDDIEILKKHFREVFPDSARNPSAEQPQTTRDLSFTMHLTLAGLSILASAPGKVYESATANLALKLGSLQLKATNVSPKDNTVLTLPEVIAQFKQISIEMTLSENDTLRRCGNVEFSASFHATAQSESQIEKRLYSVRSSGLEVNVVADTASAVVDVLNHLQDKIKELDLSKERKYLRKLRHTKSRVTDREANETANAEDTTSVSSGVLFTSSYSLELLNIQISWIVGNSVPAYPGIEPEDLVLSFRRIDLSTKREDAARLMIEDMQLQMIPSSVDKKQRSLNSALLPEVVFNVAYSSTKDDRKLAFQAAGKSLDLRLESRFILPANVLEQSIALAGKKFRAASATWNTMPTSTGAQRKSPFGNKRLSSLLVDADFAGAVVHLQGIRDSSGMDTNLDRSRDSRKQQKGRYSQFISDGSANSTSLRAPGVALKVEFKDDGHEPSLNAELKVDASNNTLYPTVVPLIMDISNSIKQVVRDSDESTGSEKDPQLEPSRRLLDEENLITADPSAILGKTRLNLGLRIRKQEFCLSCQPIARVAAMARLDDMYVTVNSVKSQDHGHFFAISAAIEKLQVSVQHVYSRESTFGFDVDSIVLSLMNSKHLSGTSGISAILKINPMRTQINARQLQDFLLFREIWVPPEIRQSSKPPAPTVRTEPQEYLVQRYQQVAAAAAFPWNANISIAEVFVELDLGQAIGKTSLTISNLWASSKKNSDWEQNLCIGVEAIRVNSQGRTSGLIELSGVKVRTSISWPSRTIDIRQTPLIQASLGFQKFRVKAAFDFQAFVIADIENFDFLMYNVREEVKGRDRLVAILDGDKVHVFCTATSAAQGLALYQAIERLVQDNQQSYAQSLRDIEKFLRRKSSVIPFRAPSQTLIPIKSTPDTLKAPISLHTDVVVTLRSINMGVFPSTFTDNQIFMLEASDAQARFAVALDNGKIHSGLGMTLGQLSVALAPVSQPKQSKTVGDITIDEVVATVRATRGGTILRVPRVVAAMQTWQSPDSNHIDYIFKSSLEGKVDVGWNYSRISFIRTMWSNHSRSLASRLGKPLPESALKITTPEKPETVSADTAGTQPAEREKITAVVTVPQSKYDYTALEPPIIETPQLRDMGEATPPLEWIGLHRDRLPNVTHQIVIVTLLEVAKEVEDAYGRILGSS